MKQFEYDLSKAFAPMPGQFHENIEEAFERGEIYMKKRHKIMTLLSAAAVLAVAFAVGALAVNNLNTPAPDRVTVAQPQATLTPEPEEKSGQDELRSMNTPAPDRVTTAQPQATLPPDSINSEEDSGQDALHFIEGDPSDPGALYLLLSNAYWTYVQENGLDADSRLIYTMTVELEYCWAEIKDDENCDDVIRQRLMEGMGLSESFIAGHDLVNDVIACLRSMGLVQSETEIRLEADDGENIGSAAEPSDDKADSGEAAQENISQNLEESNVELDTLSSEEKERIAAEYALFGVWYDREADAWYYKEALVRSFRDVLRLPEEEEGNVRAFYNPEGAVDIQALRDYSAPDSHGCGKLTGVAPLDSKEMEYALEEARSGAAPNG